MGFDYRLHVFRSPRFRSVVAEAVEFFESTPVHRLPPPDTFAGTGVYGLYYVGDHELYAEISCVNKRECIQPIYVGKAVPPGWRSARSQETEAPVLYGRLQEHARSIRQAQDLRLMASFAGS
jgi:hypothetical protein